MPTPKRLILELFLPRGRIDRRGLLAVALLMLSLQIMAGAVITGVKASPGHPTVIALHVLFFWLATAAVAKRLHDLGMSAWVVAKVAIGVLLWSVVVSAVLMIALGPAAMNQGQPGFWIAVALTTLPILAMTLWLHCAPGMPSANRFGPAVGGPWPFASGDAYANIDGGGRSASV